MGFETAKINLNGYRNEHSNGNGVIYDDEERDQSSDTSMVSSPSSSLLSVTSSPLRYIEHHVTKLDTLAGVAIRYGVEVADIKKMNGLVTDLQMFALKTLQIPLPGRHPPSPCLSNGHSSAGPCSSDQTPSRHIHSDLLETFQSLKLTPDRNASPAMSSLRDFYGLNGRRNSSEGYELAVYNKGSTSYQENEGFSTSSSLMMNLPLNQNRRSRSVANGLKMDELESESTNDIHTRYRKWVDSLNIRPQKTEEDSRTPEKLLKEENASGGWLSRISGKKGLSLRAKSANPTNLAYMAESGGENGFPCNLGESVIGESSSGVRKSISTPTLQDQDGNDNVSIWSVSNWSLTPELQAAFANPIFDGLPKPITGRRGKAAMD
ncbi:hypothetical protein RND81_01G071900 [Saponaria officinalis]|uniref:LysM domain-containing protein n=1 Tax=Saponaria officinalis TaxID=3572 RepID=A0AAW1NDA7_SAPOF